MEETKGLSDRLIGLSGSDMYPFHMPGHKRQSLGMPDPYSIDITEINGFDDLHYPKGVLRTLEERWAQLYGAGECILSVGGSTACNMAAIFAAVSRGECVMVAVNCHKSIYNAISLRPCNVEWLYPEVNEDGIFEGVRLKDVEESFSASQRTPAALVLTHPTYEGMLSDMESICAFCHEKGIAVVVDAAHGAHFGIDETQPANPLSLGADAVIMSLHKTLPALTQSACIVTSKNSLIDPEEIRRYMHCFETSSPSYVLLSGMEKCLDELEKAGKEGWRRYSLNIDRFYGEVKKLTHIKLMETDGRDPGKLLFSAENMTGESLSDRLRRDFHIETEMYFGKYVLAMTGICDTDEGFDRLLDALLKINDEISGIDSDNDEILSDNTEKDIFKDIYKRKTTKIMSMFDAVSRRHVRVSLAESAGCIAGDMVCAYPPGIPFIVPGQLIFAKDIELIYAGMKLGYNITGADGERICVVAI